MRIRLSLADAGQMPQFQVMVIEHLRRFAFHDGVPELVWSEGTQDDAVSFATVPDFVDIDVESTGILKDHPVRVLGRTVMTTYSEGPGRPLLLFHGLGGSAHSFLPVMPALEAAGFRPIAVNMPGYRGSNRLRDDLTLAQFAEHLSAFLDAIAVMRADILGHSLGGVLAAVLAHASPDRVGRVVLSSPPKGFGLGAPESWPDAQTKRVADLIAEGPELYAATRAAGLCAESADASAVEAVLREMALLTPEGLRAASSLFCPRQSA